MNKILISALIAFIIGFFSNRIYMTESSSEVKESTADIGCGYGRDSNWMNQNVFQVSAIDFDFILNQFDPAGLLFSEDKFSTSSQKRVFRMVW